MPLLAAGVIAGNAGVCITSLVLHITGLGAVPPDDLAQPVEKSPCDLADLADEAVALLARLAREKGATLEAKLEGAHVLADPARLVMVERLARGPAYGVPWDRAGP